MSSRDRKSAFSYRVPEKYAEATAFVKDFSTMMCNSQVGETDTWKPGMTTNPILPIYYLLIVLARKHLALSLLEP